MRTYLSQPATILAAFAAFLLSALANQPAGAAEVARVPWFAKGAPAHGPGNTVRYFFPEIGANRRLEIQFVTCGLNATSGSAPLNTYLGANDALSNSTRRHLLVWTERSAAGLLFEISQPIVFAINAGERAQVGYTYVSAGNLTFLPCTLSGELVFLQ